jgi:hypothetical protein
MHEIQLKQFNNAIRTLDLLKAKYAAEHPITGKKLGSLELAKPIKPAKRVKKRKVFNFGAVDFKKPLETMDVGDVVEFKFIDDIPVYNLQSRLCTEAYKIFGPSNYTTHVCRKAEAVQILRTA